MLLQKNLLWFFNIGFNSFKQYLCKNMRFPLPLPPLWTPMLVPCNLFLNRHTFCYSWKTRLGSTRSRKRTACGRNPSVGHLTASPRARLPSPWTSRLSTPTMSTAFRNMPTSSVWPTPQQEIRTGTCHLKWALARPDAQSAFLQLSFDVHISWIWNTVDVRNPASEIRKQFSQVCATKCPKSELCWLHHASLGTRLNCLSNN